MQPVTWLTGFSLGRGSALLPLTGRRGTITAEQPRGPGDERRRYRRFAGTLLTGFLGSGKTTLLRRALAAPSFSDTAVIVNEVGAIPIDHFLVDFVEGGVLELPGGCLCCMVREDLAQSLRNLIERRDAGELRPFRRVAIETSGLADPAPILFTLGADPMLDQRLRLGRVVTLVDAVEGASTLDRFAEAARQVAVADALVVSKTDLAPFGPALAERLDALNPSAERILGAELEDQATALFSPSKRPHPNPPPQAREGGIAPTATTLPRLLGREVRGEAEDGWEFGGESHAHSHGIAVFAVTFQSAISRFDFARALGGLARDRGSTRCSRRNGSTAGRIRTIAAASSLSCMTSRPRRFSGISPSPRRP